MKNKKFWVWKNQADEGSERVLELYGTIAEESWFDDDVTPQMFRDELFAGSGDVVIWLNSPGGDCIAASQIYSMLMDYKGNVTVKIDGIAASAASVIAMAGTRVLMAPTALMMIHNPATVAFGDHEDMQKAIEMLEEVKESIINAYEIRTNLSHTQLSHMMDETTWMNAKKAIELDKTDGEPYMIIGYLYASSNKECNANPLHAKAVFWAAVDKFQKAKEVDPSMASKANEMIKEYSKLFPTSEDAFFYNVFEGDTYEVECWINETTKARFSN